MGHTYTSIHVHVVFSTKNRAPILTPEIRERLFAYLGGLARERGMTAVAVGGHDDHIHLLIQVPAALALAKSVQELKAVSSKWMHETFPQTGGFGWQEGYGAFSVGRSQINRTVDYIGGQAEHHRKKTFQEEFVSFLKAHGIDYDAKHVWG